MINMQLLADIGLYHQATNTTLFLRTRHLSYDQDTDAAYNAKLEELFVRCDEEVDSNFFELFNNPVYLSLQTDFLIKYITSTKQRRDRLLSINNGSFEMLRLYLVQIYGHISSNLRFNLEYERQFLIDEILYVDNQLDTNPNLSFEERAFLQAVCAFILLKSDIVFSAVSTEITCDANKEWTAYCVDRIKDYLTQGCSIGEVDPKGNTLLHLVIKASKEEYAEVISILINNNADVNIKNKHGSSPLMLAASSYCEHSNVLQQMLNQRSDLSADDLVDAISQLIYGTHEVKNDEFKLSLGLLSARLQMMPFWLHSHAAIMHNLIMGIPTGKHTNQYFSFDKYIYYLSTLQQPLSNTIISLALYPKVLAELVAEIINSPFLDAETSKMENDVFTYLARHPEACKILLNAGFSDFYKNSHRQRLLESAKAKKLFALINDESALDIAKETKNIQFFVLIIQAIAPNFSWADQRKIHNAVYSMDASLAEIEPLREYLEKYAEQKSVFVGWLGVSSRISLLQKIDEKYIPAAPKFALCGYNFGRPPL